MIRIGIIDDEAEMRNQIQVCIEKTIKQSDGVEIYTFSDAESFLKMLYEGKTFEIVFTDIQMINMDGMTLGREIRRLQPELFIVYVTSYMEYAAESYVIEAYQYILKQDMEYRLPRVVEQLLDKINKKSKRYRIVGTGAEYKQIYYSDIIYIYKLKATKYVCYVTKDGEYRERISIENLIKEINDNNFITVERGYIVNLQHISRIAGNILYLEQDNQVSISRARIPEVKQRLLQYWREER